jgi:hypothetical protein
MPGDSPDSSEKVTSFFIDERGFLSLPLYLFVVILLQLPSITKIGQEPKCGHETAMFSGRTIYVVGLLHLLPLVTSLLGLGQDRQQFPDGGAAGPTRIRCQLASH